MRNARKLSLLAVSLFIFSFITAQSSVEIWIRAFIPNPENAGAASGYINYFPGGSSVGLRDNNGALLNLCFATDHRGFSSDPAKSSRLETKFTLTLNADGTGTVSPAGVRTKAAITTKVNCVGGAPLAQKMGSVDQDNIGTPAVADGIVQVIGGAAGTNLLTILGGAAPSIDYSFDIQWKPSTSTLKVTATIGSFPAFEMYARKPGGSWTAIVQSLPAGSPWTLGLNAFGINMSNVTVTKTL